MYSLDSLLDDLSAIEEKDLKSTREAKAVKTIKFTPHPPATGKDVAKTSSSNSISLENPKNRFVSENINSSSSKHEVLPNTTATFNGNQNRSYGIHPSSRQDNSFDSITSTNNFTPPHQNSGNSYCQDSYNDQSLDDLLSNLSKSPSPIDTKVVPQYKPSSSIVFKPPTNLDLSFFSSLNSDAPSVAATAKETGPSSYLNKFNDSSADSIKVANTSSSAKARCSKVALAGSASSRGHKMSAFSKCVCDNLRCLQCNFTVHWFKDAAWEPTVDYMFLRNNMPNREKLSAKIRTSSGSCAYCCQCSWTDATDERQLLAGQVAADPQWTCAGH